METVHLIPFLYFIKITTVSENIQSKLYRTEKKTYNYILTFDFNVSKVFIFVLLLQSICRYYLTVVK